MIKKSLFIFLFCFISYGQIITRIQRPVEDMYAINDWESYLAYSKITGIVESDRIIFFATNGAGILRFDKFTQAFINPLTRSNGLVSNTISNVYISAADTTNVYKTEIGIETPRGSQAFSLDQTESFSLTTQITSSFRKGKRAQSIRPYTNEDNFVLDLPYTYTQNGEIRGAEFDTYKLRGKYEDLNRGQWLVVDGFGLFYAEQVSSIYKAIKHGPISNSVRSLAYYKNDIFLGQSGSSKKPILSRWQENGDWEHWRKDYVTELNASLVNKVIEAKDTLWLATNTGLISYDLGLNRFKNYRHEGLYNAAVYDIFPYKNELLLATSKGLYTYKFDINSVRQYKFAMLGTVGVQSVAEDDRFLFCVTRFSVYKIDKEEGTIEDFSKSLDFASIRTNIVRYINGKFWFDNSDGIFFFDPKTEESTQIVLTSGNFKLNISDIAEENGNLFLASNKGLIIFFAKQKEWVWITKREGLPSNSVNDLLLDGDHIIIATSAGVSRFFWNDISRF